MGSANQAPAGLELLLSDLSCRVVDQTSLFSSVPACSEPPFLAFNHAPDASSSTTPRSPSGCNYIHPLQSLPEDIEYTYQAPRDSFESLSLGSSPLAASLYHLASQQGWAAPSSAAGDGHSHHAPPQRCWSDVGHSSVRLSAHADFRGEPSACSLQARREPTDLGLLKELWGVLPLVLAPQEIHIHTVWPGTTCHTSAPLPMPRSRSSCRLTSGEDGDTDSAATFFRSASASPCLAPSGAFAFAVAAAAAARPASGQPLPAGVRQAFPHPMTMAPAPPRSVPVRPARSHDYASASAPSAGRSLSAQLLACETLAGSLICSSPPSHSPTGNPSRLVKSTSAVDLAACGEGRVRGGRAPVVADSDSRVRGGRQLDNGNRGGGAAISRSASCMTLSSMPRSPSQVFGSMAQFHGGSSFGGGGSSMRRSLSSISCSSTGSEKVKGGSGSMEGRVRDGQFVAETVKVASPPRAISVFGQPQSQAQASRPFYGSKSVPVSSLSLHLHASDACESSLPSSALDRLDSALSWCSFEELSLPACSAAASVGRQRQRAFKVRPLGRTSADLSSCGDLSDLLPHAASLPTHAFGSLGSEGGVGGCGGGSFGSASYGGNGGGEWGLPSSLTHHASLGTLLELAEQQVQRHAVALFGASAAAAPRYSRSASMPTWDEANMERLSSLSGGLSGRFEDSGDNSGGGAGDLARSASENFGGFSLPSTPGGGLGESLRDSSAGGGSKYLSHDCLGALAGLEDFVFMLPRASGGGGGGDGLPGDGLCRP